MKNRFFRMLALFLTLCILLPAALACSKDPATTPGDTTATTDTPGATPEPPETYGDPVQNPEPGPAFTLGEPLTADELAHLDRLASSVEKLFAGDGATTLLDRLLQAIESGAVDASLELSDWMLNWTYAYPWIENCKLEYHQTVTEDGTPVLSIVLSWDGIEPIPLELYDLEDGSVVITSPLLEDAYCFTEEELTAFLTEVLSGTYDEDTTGLYEPLVFYDGENRYERADTESVPLYFSLTSNRMTVSSYSFRDLLDCGINKILYANLMGQANEDGFILVTEENYEGLWVLCSAYLDVFGENIFNPSGTVNEALLEEFLFIYSGPKEEDIQPEPGQNGSIPGIGDFSETPDSPSYEDLILSWLEKNTDTFTSLAELVFADCLDVLSKSISVEGSTRTVRKTYGDIGVNVTNVKIHLTTEMFLGILESLRENVAQNPEVRALLNSLLVATGWSDALEMTDEGGGNLWVSLVMKSIDEALLNMEAEIYQRGAVVDMTFYISADNGALTAAEIVMTTSDGQREELFSFYRIPTWSDGKETVISLGTYRVEILTAANRNEFTVRFYDGNMPLGMINYMRLPQTDLFTLSFSEPKGSSWESVVSIRGTYKKSVAETKLFLEYIYYQQENRRVYLNWDITLNKENTAEAVPECKSYMEMSSSDRRALVRTYEKLFAFLATLTVAEVEE